MELTEVRRASGTGGRIIGIDVARAIAMLGMVIVHYAWPDGSGGILEFTALAATGRSMPLFILLGGVGAVILTERSATPDRDLAVRAAILLPLGFLLQELTTWIQIILQSYSLFFLLAIGLRRLSGRALLALAGLVTAVGAWTYQVVGPRLPELTWVGDLLADPLTLVWSLLFNGYYPFFPVGAFFILGMWLARLDLRSTRVAGVMAVTGTVVGVGTAWLAQRWVAAGGYEAEVFDPSDSGPVVFSTARLLDVAGHSQMPAWVISSTGTAVAVMGICLLVAPRLRVWMGPLVAVGQLALTFYAFQAILVRFTPHPETTPLVEEYGYVAAIYVGFTVFAVAWKRRLGPGPLEALLRLRWGRRPAHEERTT